MAKYVISDLHGEYNKFLEMLKLINYNNKVDELHILGDVFDRGSRPIDLLDYIAGDKSMTLYRGNHETMFLDYFTDADSRLWFYNGGESTLAQINQRGYEYEYSLYRYVKKLPLIGVVDKFILVHAGLFLPSNYNDLTLEELLEIQEEEINIWTRDYIYSDKKYKDYTIICGHNITLTIEGNNNSIIHRKGHIFIDTGCHFEKHGGRLSCLRLDDMKEFYL